MTKFKNKDGISQVTKKMRIEVLILVFDFCLPKYLKKDKKVSTESTAKNLLEEGYCISQLK